MLAPVRVGVPDSPTATGAMSPSSRSAAGGDHWPLMTSWEHLGGTTPHCAGPPTDLGLVSSRCVGVLVARSAAWPGGGIAARVGGAHRGADHHTATWRVAASGIAIAA